MINLGYKHECRSAGCHQPAAIGSKFCPNCEIKLMETFKISNLPKVSTSNETKPLMSSKYPKYYKYVGDKDEVDVYAIHQLFNIQDPSGAIQHASKKLLLSGVRTGGKTKYQDIQEARDTLTRWLELHSDSSNSD